MSKIFLAVLATALGTAATVTFPQSANADYPYNHRPDYYREDHSYHDRHYDHQGYYREYYPHHYDREYYPRRSYYGGYDYPRSHFQLVVPVIIR